MHNDLTEVLDITKAHWYITTGMIWVTGADVRTMMARLRKENELYVGQVQPHLMVVVVYVPIPEESEYKISCYIPVVPDTEVICTTYLYPEVV